MFTKLAEDIEKAAQIKLASKWQRALSALRSSKGLPAPSIEELATIAREAKYSPSSAYLPPRRYNVREWNTPTLEKITAPSLDWHYGRENIPLPPLQAPHGPLSPEMMKYINKAPTYDPQLGSLEGLFNPRYVY